MGIREEIYRDTGVEPFVRKYIKADTFITKRDLILSKSVSGLDGFYESTQKYRDGEKILASATSNIRLSDSTITLRNKIIGASE